jgi:sugar phosphate isomerase/epimerase
MRCSRRDLLKWGAGTTAIWTAGLRSARLSAAPAKKIPIALQLYSVRDLMAKDLPGTVAAVAKMGYQGVEFAGYYGRSAKELRTILDQNGLKCCGTHLQLDALRGDALNHTIEFNQTLGNKFLIVSWLPPTVTTSIAALTATAKLFTELAGKVKGAGMRVGYHAHAHDFKPVADQIPWEVFFANAGPEVTMQLDTGNCLDGGGDPVAELKRFPHRSATIHLKEHGGPQGAVIGEGTVPWPKIFELCETTGDTQWYILEQETYRDSALDTVQQCLQNVHKMGK